MDRCIATVIKDKDPCRVRNEVISKELNPDFIYVIQYIDELDEWISHCCLNFAEVKERFEL